MFLMGRLVSRSARSLAVMLGAATSAQGRGRDHLRGKPAFTYVARRSRTIRSTPQHSIPFDSE